MDLSKNITQQARIEDITLKEDFGTFVATQDDDFGDMGSFGLDMDTFMMSDMERGRRLGNSLVGNDQMGDDFFDDRLNEQSAFDSEFFGSIKIEYSIYNRKHDRNFILNIYFIQYIYV